MDRQMILKSIESYYELALKNLLRNMPQIMSKTLAQDKAYRKIMLKKKAQDVIFFKPEERVSNGYKYVIFPKSYGKSDYKRKGLIYHVVTPFYIDGRQFYIMYNKDFTACQVYTKHFFERYMERHLGLCGTPDYYIISNYLKDTDCVVAYSDINIDKYENCIYGSTRIGVGCGTRISQNVILFNTYIDNSTVVNGLKKEIKNVGCKLFSQLFDKHGVRVAFLP